jgi:DNA-binding IclR family transcriptional regulator
MLEQIGADTGEDVHLAVANGAQIAHIANVDSTYLLGARDWSDIEIPPHSSALGKVLLAWDVLPRPDGRLETPTGHTLRTRGVLDADLAQVRARGFAVTRDELEVGLAGVAAPVFGPDNDAVAAVGVSGPTARLADRVDSLGQLLKEQTAELSTILRHGTHSQGPERDMA